MAKIVQRNFDKVVDTIADRDLIDVKQIGTVVKVENANDDPDVGGAYYAFYTWDGVTWVLSQKGGIDAASFLTESVLITNGIATLSNLPIDGNIWEVSVNDPSTNEVIYHLAQENLSVSFYEVINLEEYNGLNFRCSYAFGTVVSQVSTLIEDSNTLGTF